MSKYLADDMWLPRNFEFRLQSFKDHGPRKSQNVNEYRIWLSYIIHGLRRSLNLT